MKQPIPITVRMLMRQNGFQNQEFVELVMRRIVSLMMTLIISSLDAVTCILKNLTECEMRMCIMRAAAFAMNAIVLLMIL
jgi:hypothetical protein